MYAIDQLGWFICKSVSTPLLWISTQTIRITMKHHIHVQGNWVILLSDPYFGRYSTYGVDHIGTLENGIIGFNLTL